MITELGKNHIRQYLAGIAPTIGQYIAVGTRPVTPSTSDTSMGFEVTRVEVTGTSVDPTTDKIIFKSTLESGNDAKIYEIGLWYSPLNVDTGVMLNFEYQDMDWSGDLVDYTGPAVAVPHRVGSEGIMIQPGNTMSTTTDIIDLSPWLGPEDEWILGMAAQGASSGTTVTLKVLSTEGSYMEIPFAFPATTGPEYQFSTFNIKNATTVGAFNPAMVEGYELTVTGGPTWMTLDAVVANNAPAERDGSVLVARALIDPPFITDAEGSCDIEYELGVIV